MISFHVPSVAMRVSVRQFFDRAAVKEALGAMNLKAFSIASLKVKNIAKESIKKKGLAKPILKVMRDNPGSTLSSLLADPSTSKKNRRAVMERIREIKAKEPSPPGTPPHTHVPYGHMLGFRRNLWNFYDSSSHSAVVGPSKKGRQLPYLHEFGGTITMRLWAWIPQKYTKSGKMRSPIIMRLPIGTSPRNTGKWRPLSVTERSDYPERPFMRPAMMKAIANGSIAKAFGGKFVAKSGRGGTIIGRG
jgi:hypothetical protein